MRDYPEWEMGSGVTRSLGELMTKAVFGDLSDGADVRAAVEAIGKTELAFLLSGGATSKKDRAYKSARDRISRYLRGARQPNTASRNAIAAVARAWRVKQLKARGTLRVTVVATVQTSRTSWTGAADAVLSGEDLAAFADALGAGDPVAATQVVYDGYGLDPGLVLGMSDVADIEIR